MRAVDRVAHLSPSVTGRFQGRTLERAVRDKVVVVTGASSGIGEATAEALGAAGARVVLVARRAEALEATRARIGAAGGEAAVHPADLSDLSDVDRLVAEVLDAHGRVDVLVNSAGRSIRRSAHLSRDRFHDFERTMQLNYFGAIRLILGVLPSMRERKKGHIVNVSSVGVQAGAPRFSGYIASKAALDAFSDSVQAEVRSDRVRFTTVYMPLVRTPMIAPTKIYERMPAISPQQAAAMIGDAITYRPRRVGTVMGTVAGVGGAIAPRATDAVRAWAYDLFPESGTAEEVDGDPEGGVGARGRVFSRVFRGGHW